MEMKWICIALIAYIFVGLGKEALNMYEGLEKEKIEASKIIFKEEHIKQDLDYVEIERNN